MSSTSSSGTVATLVLWGGERATFTINVNDLSTYKLTSDELVNVSCLKVTNLSKTVYDKSAVWKFCSNNLPLIDLLVSIQFELRIEEHPVITRFDNLLRHNQIHYHMINLVNARYIITPKIMGSSNPYNKLTLPEFIKNKITEDKNGKDIAE